MLTIPFGHRACEDAADTLHPATYVKSLMVKRHRQHRALHTGRREPPIPSHIVRQKTWGSGAKSTVQEREQQCQQKSQAFCFHDRDCSASQDRVKPVCLIRSYRSILGMALFVKQIRVGGMMHSMRRPNLGTSSRLTPLRWMLAVWSVAVLLGRLQGAETRAEPWLQPYTGSTRSDIDAATLDGQVLCGY